MCIGKTPKIPTPVAPLIAAPAGREATTASDDEARLRRARSGAAANILTSPLGLPGGKLG